MGRKVVATKAEVAAERSASLARQTGVSNAYTSGLHPELERVPLGNGAYKVTSTTRFDRDFDFLLGGYD